MSRWKWEIAAPFFGILTTLSFAPYGYSYLILLAVSFFYLACQTASLTRAFTFGFLFGMGVFTTGVWWLYVSMHDFGGADAVSAGLLVGLCSSILALFPALTAMLSVKYLPLFGLASRIVLFALIWTVVEYLRGYVIVNGFPWLMIAYSQIDTPLAGYAPLIGAYGINFLLAVSAAILIESWRKRKVFIKQGSLLLLLIWGGGYGLQGWSWTQASGDPLTITVVQGNIPQQDKWLPERRWQALNLYWQLTSQHWDSDVVIWPETAIPAFLDEVEEDFVMPLAKQARERGVDLVVSLPTRDRDKHYYNSVMSLGRYQALYHKQHLLPFGEYLPLQPLSGWVLQQLQIPLGNFAAGDEKQPLLQAGGYPFVTTICYEDVFGELVAGQSEQAAYLVNVTNDAWFGQSSQPHQHMQMSQMRALESGRYMVRSTNSGVSGFIKPDGTISKQAPVDITTTLTDQVIPMTGLTPYARWGDAAVFAALIGLFLAMQAPGWWKCGLVRCKQLVENKAG